jgi:hypothetical protein
VTLATSDLELGVSESTRHDLPVGEGHREVFTRISLHDCPRYGQVTACFARS